MENDLNSPLYLRSPASWLTDSAILSVFSEKGWQVPRLSPSQTLKEASASSLWQSNLLYSSSSAIVAAPLGQLEFLQAGCEHEGVGHGVVVDDGGVVHGVTVVLLEVLHEVVKVVDCLHEGVGVVMGGHGVVVDEHTVAVTVVVVTDVTVTVPAEQSLQRFSGTAAAVTPRT